MIKTRKRQSKYFAPQNEDNYHICDHPNCNKAGEYRAPKDRNLKEYYWFCLKHVQEYNARWNYYEDELYSNSEDKINGQNFKFSSRIKYNFGFDFSGGYNFFEDSSYSKRDNIYLTVEERQALKIMELEYEELNINNLKKAYKIAVKKYHPDINSSDKTAEEKFKILSTAYKSLINKIS
ncbi:MAG: hypothetical protein E7020_04780 [Alphaproteobacteria bacterium]|nr:hypothetical protein [Alphaproteobacteria bacterium]